MSSSEEENMVLIRSWLMDVLLSKKKGESALNMAYIREKAPEYGEENYVAHHDPLAKGREGMLSRLEVLSIAFSDPQIEILSLFAKGDMVADCFRVSANQTGPLLGIPSTGKRVSWLQNEIFKIKNGKITEGWITRDSLARSPPATRSVQEWVSISSMKKEMLNDKTNFSFHGNRAHTLLKSGAYHDQKHFEPLHRS